MDGITVKQALGEVVREYRHLIKTGMPPHQAFSVLEEMLYDLIEFEKTKAYDLGIEVGQYGVLHDLRLYRDIEHILKKYKVD